MIMFLVRHFNDIDHIVPIVYRMLKDDSEELRVFCMNASLDLENDFRLSFLKGQFGCRTKYIFQAYKPTLRHHLFSLLVCWLPRLKLPTGLGWLSRIFGKVSYKVYNSTWRDRLYDKAWARRLLQRYGVRTLVVDWGKVTRFAYEPISDAADELRVRKIGVPHGMTLMANDDSTTRTVTQQRPIDWGEQYGWLDEVIVQGHPMKEQYVRGGYPAKQISVLGSARFCQEWMVVYRSILPPQQLQQEDERLRIVYMDHDKLYRLDTDEIVNTFREISKATWATVIVKKSTRTRLSDGRLADLVPVDTVTSSVHLVRWADVVISTISSIMLEVLDQGKIFIYPTGFTENEMLFERYGACWAVSSKDELLAALRAIHDGTHVLPYSDANVKAFQNEVVYGGDPEADVLAKYVDHIAASQRQTTISVSG